MENDTVYNDSPKSLSSQLCIEALNDFQSTKDIGILLALQEKWGNDPVYKDYKILLNKQEKREISMIQ